MTAPDACESCGRKRPLELQMTTKSGTVLSMLSCPRCETRIWLADGEPVTKDDVLRLASDDAAFVFVPRPGKERRAAGRR